MRLKYPTFLMTFIATLFLTSCLTDAGQEDSPSQYAVDFQLQDVSDAQTEAGDTLEIRGVSFLQGPIALRTTSEDSTVLYAGNGVFNYQFPAAEYQRLLSGSLDAGTYGSLLYHIETAETGNEDIPEEFIDGEEEGQQYSMIISGQFNSSDFVYKSAQSFDFEFSLGSPVDIPENNTTLALGVNFDIHQVFLNTEGTGLLDPSDPANAEQIDSNIQDAIGLLPFNEN